MNQELKARNIQPGKLKEGKENISEDVKLSSKEIDDIKSQMLNMQMEIDILKETINVLKKDPGIDQTALKNREKVAIIDALKERYSLLALLDKLVLSKSSYYYQEKVLNGPDKYEMLRPKVKLLFEENKKRYGYRRIYGLLVTWNISTKPNAALVNTMLDNAIATLHKNEHPILYSDRGCHYRWNEWIEKMEEAELIRSMSKKGCSPDNSACEGVFGRLKNEMFYNSDWTDISIACPRKRPHPHLFLKKLVKSCNI